MISSAAPMVPGNGSERSRLVSGVRGFAAGDAGLVHATSYLGPDGSPAPVMSLAGDLPKRVLSGGSSSKVEYATAQRTCAGAVHRGTCVKSPPITPPLRTRTLPPSRIA